MSGPRLRFEDAEFAAELDPGAIAPAAADGVAASPWELTAAPDWSRFDCLRLLAARFGDGSLVAVAALRPAGARGHDAERVSAAFSDRGKSPGIVHEALLSTELDSERRVRRVGLELWMTDEPPPRRLAADRTAVRNGAERESVAMEARLDGEAGTAVFEVLRPARP